MNDKALAKRQIWRVLPSGEARQVDDEELRERPLLLEVDGQEEAAVILSPGDEELWALGHLFSRKMIVSRDEILSVETKDDRVSVRRVLARQGLPLRSRVVHTASTRLIEADAVRTACLPLPVRWALKAAVVSKAVEALAQGPLFLRTGSAHVALLASKEGQSLFLAEDVGRHNAMDKAIGWALLEGIDLGECFMALSGRLPADMVYKALGSGIPLLASVSAATLSGIEAAAAGGITLIGFARRGQMNVYSVPERIVEVAAGA